VIVKLITKVIRGLVRTPLCGRPSLAGISRGASKGRSQRNTYRGHASLSVLFLVLIAALLAGACHRDIEQSLARAVEAWNSGNYKLAAEEYERYLYQRPTDEKASDARFQLANIYYFKLKRYDQARIQYTAFLEQNPSHPNSQLARERVAEVLGEMGRSYEAIAEYENLNPQDSGERRRIRLRIADLYFAQRNYSQALTEYEKVIEHVPYDELSEQAYLREASIYHIERGQYQQAIPVYQALASASADGKVRVRAMYGLADCYAGLYQFDEAIKTLHAIKDEAEQTDVARRVTELEQQRREAAQARSGQQMVKPVRRPEEQQPGKPAAVQGGAPAKEQGSGGAGEQGSKGSGQQNVARAADRRGNAVGQQNVAGAREQRSTRISQQNVAGAPQQRSKASGQQNVAGAGTRRSRGTGQQNAGANGDQGNRRRAKAQRNGGVPPKP
jgi:tetratricopeptide (TPR) repeat protein